LGFPQDITLNQLLAVEKNRKSGGPAQPKCRGGMDATHDRMHAGAGSGCAAEWGHRALPATANSPSGPLSLSICLVKEYRGGRGDVQRIDGFCHGDGDGIVAGGQDFRREAKSLAAEDDATVGGKIGLGQSSIRRVRVGGDAFHTSGAQSVERGLEAGGLHNRKLEKGAHGIPHRAAEERAAGGFPDDEGLDAKGDAIANQGAQVLRVGEGVHGGEQPRSGASGDDLLERRRLGNPANGEDSLEHGKADQFFEDLLLAHDIDGKFGFGPGFEQWFVVGQPLVREQDGHHFKSAFQEPSDHLLAFRYKDALTLMVQRASQRAVRRQFGKVEIINKLLANHPAWKGIAPSLPYVASFQGSDGALPARESQGEGRARDALGRQLEPHMVGANPLQPFLGDAARQFGSIALAAEVSQVQMAQVGRHDRFGGVGGGLVGEVTLASENALFEAPGTVRTFLEHADIVVGLQHQHIRVADSIEDVFGDVTEVRDETDIAGGGPEQEPDRILGVVRDVEGLDDDVADFKTLACFEEAAVEACAEGAFRFLLGGAVAVDGDAEFAGDADESLDMVAVLVGDEDGIEVFGRAAEGGQSLADLSGAEAGVDEDSGFRRFHVGAIARGTASQNRQLNSHGPP